MHYRLHFVLTVNKFTGVDKVKYTLVDQAEKIRT